MKSHLEATMEQDWWWRDKNSRISLLLKLLVLERKDADRAAWLYELARREATTQKLPPFNKLPDEVFLKWVECFGETEDPTKKTHRSTGIWNLIPQPGWTRPAPIEWNLHAPLNSVVRDFKMFIALEKFHQNIRPSEQGPKGKVSRNKGRKNRPFSWAWPELMDRVAAKEKLNSSERSSLSEARKAARAFLASQPELRMVLMGVEKCGN